MKDSIKKRKNKLLALCLSAMMISSVAAFASCTDSSSTDSSSSSSSSEAASEEKDTGLIKNAGFETFNTNNGLNAIGTSVTGWSPSVNSVSSGSARSSKAASGIVDLSEAAWKDLTTSSGKLASIANPTSDDGVKEVGKVWNELTTYDKLKYYEDWKTAHEDDDDASISKDLSFYESFNIDLDDIPTIERFATHHKEGEEGYGEDQKVLMIHNEYPDPDSTASSPIGTAQKYTSASTVTVKAGTSATFSVWVKTQDLQSSATDNSAQEAVGKGAYISVTHTVGGTTLDEYKVENINTESMDQNELSNGWKQYTFYLKGSSYTDTTFSLVLGLGQGGGTYYGEYVNGYAFFDDIKCETFLNEEFPDELPSVGFEAEGEEKIVDVSKAENADKDTFALDFYGDFTAVDIFSGFNWEATKSEAGSEGKVSSLKGDNAASWLNGGFDGTNDKKEVYDNAAAIEAAAASNEYLKIVYDNYFKGNDFASDKKTLMLLSTNGVAYTATTDYEFKFADYENPDDSTVSAEYIAVSFFVKTSDMNGTGVGAGVTLVDGENKTSFTAIDTSSISPVDIGEGENKKEDIYDGWQQYFFFVANESENDAASFKLSFNFGPTEITEDSVFHHGFAAFTNFQAYAMSKAEYESAKSGTYAKLVSVTGDKEEETTSTDGFDSTLGVPTNAIENGLANPQNYKGVYSDSQYITGKGDTTYNTNANAGLINKVYFTGEESYYTTADDAPAWMKGITANANGATTTTDIWNTVFGKDVVQPLFIWNETAGKAYGFIGASTSISADSYACVSLKVKVKGTANIYLVDTSGDKYDNSLSINRKLTYWYDDDGNIWDGDPQEKTSRMAFELQSNGLYKAKESWSGYKAEYKDKFFANLPAYGEDGDGNKIIATGGATHDYNDRWNNVGVTDVVFAKAADGKYYAYKGTSEEVLVNDLTSVTALVPRYTVTEKQDLSVTVEDTNGAWKTVTFYVHTGNLAKDYRLEVWSGDRNSESESVAAGDYVIVDKINPGTAEDNFSTLLEEYDEKVEEGENKFYSVFSYFDTANYRPYNAKLDENDYGNLYADSYTPSENEEGIAYLRYDDAEAKAITIFADYSYSEQAVTAATPEDDSSESLSSSETETDTNIWLLVSSLAIAFVLLLAIVSIIVRKIMKNVRKKRAAQASIKNNKKSK